MARTDEEPDDGEEDGRPASGGGRFSLWHRLMSGAPAPKTAPIDSPRARRRAVERLDDRERRWSYAGTLGAVVFAVTIYLTETSNHHFHLAKGQLQPQTVLILGLAAAVLLGVSTYFGRRAPVAFVALFAFLIFSNGGGIVVGLPFVALGGWLLYKSYKNQRAANAQERTATRTPSAAKADRSATSRPKTAGASKGKTGPTANKRYTPKRPPPPAPKPSRRERKAAEAKE